MEPEAIALALGLGHNDTVKKKSLVFNFGGRSLNVAILDINEGEISVE